MAIALSNHNMLVANIAKGAFRQSREETKISEETIAKDSEQS